MQLALILAILASHLAASHGPTGPASLPWARFLLVLSGAGCVIMLAVLAARFATRGTYEQLPRRIRWFSYFQRLHLMVWLAVIAASQLLFQWPRLVQFNWHLGSWVLLDDLLILAPVFVPLLLSWAAFYDVDQTLTQVQCRKGRPDTTTPTHCGRLDFVLLMSRQLLAPTVLPIVVILAVVDVIKWILPEVSHSRQVWLVLLPTVFAVLSVMPVLLRRTWNTRRLSPGPLRDRLEVTGRRAGFSPREILVWDTGGRVVNAAVAGMLPKYRCVFLSDRLLSEFDEAEIESLFAHELGHLRHRHLMLRLVAVFACMAAWTVIPTLAPRICDSLLQSLVSWGIGPHLQADLLIPVLAATSALFLLSWYSRILEFQADLWAYQSEQTDRGCGRQLEGSTYVSALKKLVVLSGENPRRGGWLHPPMCQRIQLLREIQQNPSRFGQFQRRLHWMAISLLSVCAFSAVLAIL